MFLLIKFANSNAFSGDSAIISRCMHSFSKSFVRNQASIVYLCNFFIGYGVLIKILWQKKIKLEVTEAQLVALIEITNEASSMIGGGDSQDDKDRIKWVKLIDRLLKNNGFERQYL